LSKVGDKFIREYQAGKYGYAVRGAEKALMYHQATFCKNDKQIAALKWACESQLIAVLQHNELEELTRTHCSWVKQDGGVLVCNFSGHLHIAEDIFFTKEGEFEKNHAKITRTTRSPEEAMYFVKKPSKHMIYTVNKIFEMRNK